MRDVLLNLSLQERLCKSRTWTKRQSCNRQIVYAVKRGTKQNVLRSLDLSIHLRWKRPSAPMPWPHDFPLSWLVLVGSYVSMCLSYSDDWSQVQSSHNSPSLAPEHWEHIKRSWTCPPRISSTTLYLNLIPTGSPRPYQQWFIDKNPNLETIPAISFSFALVHTHLG